ncbi:acylphosphatase [Sorangium sp. So ce119]|uniref:acylphosphatase n=1 Tax=Sorangium sp. So ce119 TaxID=3133279 RepID=UPI003F613283
MNVFLSYARADRELMERLREAMSALEREKEIKIWHDDNISAGDPIECTIDEHLDNAELIMILVSASFLGSDACYDKEMRRALERERKGEARVLPVLLRPCDWSQTPIAALSVLPIDSRPITSWPSQDEAFTSVAQGVRTIVKNLRVSGRFLWSSARRAEPGPIVDRNYVHDRGMNVAQTGAVAAREGDRDRAIYREIELDLPPRLKCKADLVIYTDRSIDLFLFADVAPRSVSFAGRIGMRLGGAWNVTIPPLVKADTLLLAIVPASGKRWTGDVVVRGSGEITVRAVATGSVQGVHYRASLRQRARQLGLTGWVRNLEESDKVEFVVQGRATDVDALISWARSGPPRESTSSQGSIDVKQKPEMDARLYESFEVRLVDVEVKQ